MKKIFAILILGIFMFSCSSNESKVEDLISDYMFKNLNDFDSYEPIETKVDSFYTSVYTDSFIVKRADNILAFMIQNEELSKQRKAHSDYIINNAKYITLDGVFEKYMAHSEASIELGNIMIEHNKTIINEGEIIKVKAGEFVSKLGGWQAIHRFRCKNAAGVYAIHNYMFYFDSDITKITSFVNLDDSKNHKLIKIIDTAIEGDGQKLINLELDNGGE